MCARQKVGIDLAPIAFRHRAPGTAVHVENQARALFAMDVEWDWVPIATPRTLADAPFFASVNPIVVPDAPLSYHASWRTGRLWQKANCTLGFSTAFFSALVGPSVVTNYFDANAFHPVRDSRNARDRLKSSLIQALWKLSRRRSRALFILSEYGRMRMGKADPATASKWVVASCGVAPLGAPSPVTPKWARSLEGRPFILYAGAFSENKNQRRLIEAWDQMRRRHATFPRLVLIGPTPADYLRDVIEPARRATSQPQEIIMPGFVPADEVTWAFANAHAYIQPSFAEGFGMPVVEAMQVGLPVACSDSTSLPEVAGNAAVLFEPSSVASIAKALETIALNEQERDRLKEAGFDRAKFFTWEKNAEIVSGRIRAELSLIAGGR